MCLPGGKAYQRDPVEECDSSREKRHYAATVGVSECTMFVQCEWVYIVQCTVSECTIYNVASVGSQCTTNTIWREGTALCANSWFEWVHSVHLQWTVYKQIPVRINFQVHNISGESELSMNTFHWELLYIVLYSDCTICTVYRVYSNTLCVNFTLPSQCTIDTISSKCTINTF